MQMIFTKNQDGEIDVAIKDGEQNIAFSYPEMILRLYKDKSLISPEIEGNFSDEEIQSINELTDELRTAII